MKKMLLLFLTACILMNISACTQTSSINNGTQSPSPVSTTQLTSPTPTTTPTISSTPTAPPNSTTQTPDSSLTNQAVSTEPTNTSRINTGVPDGTKVKLFVSGQEILWAIIMGDEVLVPDYPYTFGQLKDASGEKAGFWTITINTQGAKDYKERVTIYNSLYTIELVEGEYSFTCNDETFPLTVPAQTIDEEIYLPLIALAEAINATVEWDADEQAINFFYKQVVTPTAVSKAEEQTTDSTSTNQANSTEPENTTGVNTGLPDGTKVKLFVSGKEIHWAIIMGDEVLVPDYPYIFGQLKDAGGIEWSGFWTMSSFNNADNKEYAEIYNSLYTIEIVEGEYSFTCNDETFPLTAPAQTIGGQFHIPIAALAKAINATVEWDADSQAIKFYYE